MSLVINIFLLKINAIENGSALNVGQNFLAEWNSTAKRNEGTGSNYGDGTMFSGAANYVDDGDFMDQPSFKNPSLSGANHNLFSSARRQLFTISSRENSDCPPAKAFHREAFLFGQKRKVS
ncbi:MAG: spore germination protein [Thermoanaerobacteraceae bacterium]|nr:spore germination protein [Thermoanaerobacteraceae bacterium]